VSFCSHDISRGCPLSASAIKLKSEIGGWGEGLRYVSSWYKYMNEACREVKKVCVYLQIGQKLRWALLPKGL